MRLHEEYIKRHGLDIPVVQYERRSTIFLRSHQRESIEWRILAIQWIHVNRHPGYFEMSYVVPVHDGWREDLFRHIFRPKILYWDEYEATISKLVAEIVQDKFEAISNKDHVFALWQMFLYMHDSLIARHMPPEFYELVEDSVACSSSVSYEKAVDMLWEKIPNLYNTLKSQVLPLAAIHSQWLENLIND